MLDIHANKIIANKFVGEFENTNNNDGISIGMIIPFASNNEIPSGFLLCNGASIRKDTYIDLFNIIGTTYGSIDEEHFNLPNLNNRFLEGSNTSGIYKEAGLPNITSNGTNNLGFRAENNGAFRHLGSGGAKYNSASEISSARIGFDASYSNSIYGNSDTVQPPSLTVRYIIKAFNGTSVSTTNLEITQLANSLNDKIDKQGISDFVIESYNDEDGNWYRLYKSGWLEQGGLSPKSANTSKRIISLLMPYYDTTYNILLGTSDFDGKATLDTASWKDKTTSNFYILGGNGSTNNPNIECYWYTCGQGE